MSRNSGGTYTLPVSAFVSQTIIRSTDMNSQFSDIANALTDSLSRSGYGGMSASLRLTDGSASIPSLAFNNDPGAGLYLGGTGIIRVAVSAANLQEWRTTGVTIYPATTIDDALTVTGNLTLSGSVLTGLTVAQSTTNGAAVTATANGTGTGVAGFGGSASGSAALGLGGLFLGAGQTSVAAISTNVGAYCIGGPSSSSGNGGHGAVGQGASAAETGGGGAGVVGLGGAATAGTGSGGVGVSGIGGATFGGAGGTGGSFTGGAPTAGNLNGGAGISGTGGAASGTGSPGVGGTFAAGSAATSTTRRTALACTNGDISLDGVATPASTTAVKNAITPSNIIKAWVYFTMNGSSTITVSNGFNVASVTKSGSALLVTFEQDFTSGSAYASAVNATGTSNAGYVLTQTAGTASIMVYGVADATTLTNVSFSLMAVGLQ